MLNPPSTRNLPASTTLHRVLLRCPAGWKLLGLLAISTALVILKDPVCLLSGLVLTVLMWFLLGSARETEGVATQSRMMQMLWFAAMLLSLGGLTAWQSGLMTALGIMARLLSMVLLAVIVMRTTSLSDMMAVVERILMPLGRLGWVSPSRVALAFGMMLRFLPVLKEQWEEIQQAQAARSVKVSLSALLIPMLVRTIRRAEEVAQALDARGMSD